MMDKSGSYQHKSAEGKEKVGRKRWRKEGEKG